VFQHPAQEESVCHIIVYYQGCQTLKDIRLGFLDRSCRHSNASPDGEMETTALAWLTLQPNPAAHHFH
jgi:hypothetical protein